ncbi:MULTISPECIES: biliverdin-producing heme oxygenase [Acinetobacter]|uniref:biliverdin-producing heme oxygenase n=1 Tax=Acinetobacter TaxID=469 RepID=UPI00051C40E1|nr:MULTISPECIES: biliverdin-producing heme oxygenase [Acinetobacter]MCH7293911.1 biliverdin-producing heme oxygenase [Acinetobacter higginsii]MCH7378619.1 biliverdin-producing heme oxygenase [Acinetobacter higginsii]MCJ0827051.1 biliverdin-producing heme oxygenase [Acinetobacter sp. NIPH1876]
MATSFVLNQLASRLKIETASQHQQMHLLMEKAQVFADTERYAKFTLAQYYFQQNVEYLFRHPEVSALISDLDIRGRSQAALLDLYDLQLKPEAQELLTEKVGFPEALGWIYVSEGSTLGAAFLFKQAQQLLGLTAEFGARNLAAYPEGRARVWKHFITELDTAQLSESEQDQVILGAKQAFDYFGSLLKNID